MPGHGRAGADSHKELPVVDEDEAALEEDLEPFRTLAPRAPMGMTAHVRYTAWDAENPGTLSPFVIGEIIRKRIGFGGLLLSDDIDMQALTGGVPERSLRAIEAGCDIVLNCWAKMDDMIGTAELLPAMNEEGAARLERALAGCGQGTLGQGDREQLLATRDALLERLSDTAA
jgi:beta-N-acetylhexosaminidase